MQIYTLIVSTDELSILLIEFKANKLPVKHPELSLQAGVE